MGKLEMKKRADAWFARWHATVKARGHDAAQRHAARESRLPLPRRPRGLQRACHGAVTAAERHRGLWAHVYVPSTLERRQRRHRARVHRRSGGKTPAWRRYHRARCQRPDYTLRGHGAAVLELADAPDAHGRAADEEQNVNLFVS